MEAFSQQILIYQKLLLSFRKLLRSLANSHLLNAERANSYSTINDVFCTREKIFYAVEDPIELGLSL